MGAEKIFNLVGRAEFDTGERYITLSHCWGPGPAWEKLRLLDSTKDQLRNGLPVSVLPKTFRHAFEIIERLNVRYLWIDRLCIVQDSAEDWQAEASTMQSIYRHGLLNIAALGAADDQAGCFFDRDPAAVAPTIINLSPNEGDVPSFYRFDAEREAWRKDFEGEPLLSRAWVLQERVLSTRNLYFGRKQVFWECFETNCCETVPGNRLGTYQPPRSPESNKHAWKSLIDPGRTGSGSLVTDWPDAVQTYSQCNLSFSSDKLVALSGLAKRMGESMRVERGPGHDNYLAGLWGHTMPQSLLWRPKAHGHHITPYRAPSWSWASLDGDIVFPATNRFRWHVDVLRAETTPRGNDMTSELIGGILALRGYVCMARGFKRLQTRATERETYSIGSFYHPEADNSIVFGRRRAYLQFDTPNVSYSTVTILIFNSRVRKAFSFIEVHALALVFTDQSPHSYRRVGYVSLEETVDLEDCDYERKLFSEFRSEIVDII